MAYHYDAPISAGDQQLERLIAAPLPLALIFWQDRPALDALSPTLLEVARQQAGHLIIARLHTHDAPLGRRRFDVDETPLMIGLRRGREITRARIPDLAALHGQLTRLLTAEATSRPESTQIEEASDHSFESMVLLAQSPVLVQFAAPWLPLCRQQTRLLDSIAADYAGRLRVVHINVEENPHSAGAFAVQSLPTLLFIQHGKETGRIIGVVDAVEIRRRIERLFN